MDNTLAERIARVCNDREHGSRYLVHEAVSILHDMATAPTSSADEQVRQIHEVARMLAQARPAMAALTGAMERLLAAQGGLPGIARAAIRLLEEYDHATERIAVYVRLLLRGTILTHSLSGTVLDVLLACRTQLERVIVLEGRPRYEGRELARALAARGIAVTLITDAQAAIFLPQCHAVVVGADTVLANGDVLNKAGTALLAWAARGYGLPFYVLCESLKLSPRSWIGDLAQLEEKEAEEVLEQPLEGVAVRNFYFDHTPASLVTHVITEHGIHAFH